LMLLTLRGTPFLYYGEEIGMADGPVPAERVVDVAGRDPERTPMQWDASPNAGFTTGEPWLPVAFEAASVNVAAQRDDPASMLTLYRTLIAIRRASPALRAGAYATVPIASADVFAYRRDGGGESWLVVLNFGDAPGRVSLDAVGLTGTLRFATDPSRPLDVAVDGVVELAADEGILVELIEAEPTG
ncbi:MAG TPA: DUF3459 domain-containing protein, partial [Candidatus Limnocylindrales bacterium]|nr:DUF3459 domain-containing protein [Candidatus Limnocylindrales bacterium]